MQLIHFALNPQDSDERFAPRLGVLLGETIAEVVNLADSEKRVDLFTTPLESLRKWAALAAETGERIALSQVTPVPVPPRLIWAAGVTYKRSQEARMEESTQKDVYDKVYDAERPEIFLKCATVASSHEDPITVRSDSTWDVPEPELTLVINNQKEIVAFGIGNDVSSRSIEGENPLYLPQAKMWNGSASLSSILRLNTEDLDATILDIALKVERAGKSVFTGETNTSAMHRSFEDLVTWLHRGQDFPLGAYLMTGTGIVPGEDFTLKGGDVVTITIAEIGELRNEVVVLDVANNSLKQ